MKEYHAQGWSWGTYLCTILRTQSARIYQRINTMFTASTEGPFTNAYTRVL